MPINLTLLIQRTDIDIKPGGDLIQFSEIKKYLEKRSYKVKLLSWSPQLDLRDSNVVNLVNDRPLILADSLRMLNKMKPRPRIVISPIHHCDQEVIRLRKHGSPQSASELVLAKFLNIKPLENYLLHLINVLADLRMISASFGLVTAILTFLKNFSKVRSRKRLGSFLVSENTLQFLAKGEASSFFKDYRINEERILSKYVIPNGKPEKVFYEIHKSQMIEHPIVIAGRIEPRKRNLELARAAHKLEIPVAFLGAFANPESEYAREFLKIEKSSPFVNYLGVFSHSDTYAVITRSKVLMNVSFAEVLSLVELEAAAQGKWIVSSGAGYSNEYIASDQLKIFPEDNLYQGLEIASQLLSTPIVQFEAPNIPSWDEIADKYSTMYQEVIAEKI
jgi:glycosyltransferase involved in cell wall biosynthesis